MTQISGFGTVGLFLLFPLMLVECQQVLEELTVDGLPKKSISNVIHIYEKRLLNFIGRYDLHTLMNLKDPNWQKKAIFRTANLGDPCDMNIQKEFIEPIYDSVGRDEEVQALRKLIGHLDQYPNLARNCCFGLMNHSRGRYYTCEERPGKHPACKCKNEEPWIYKRVPKSVDTSECKLVPSHFGDKCDYHRMKEFNKTLFEPHFKAMKDAGAYAHKLETALQDYGRKFRSLIERNISPADARRVCLGITTNMECKENNKCGCLDVEPYYTYEEGTLNESGRYCFGKRNSICLFEPKSKEGVPILMRSAHCAGNMQCRFPEVLPEGVEFDYDAVHVCRASSILNFKVFSASILTMFVSIGLRLCMS